MRGITISALLLGLSVALAPGAFAQRYPYYDRDPYYGGDRGGYRDAYGDRGYRGGDPVSRALDNLQRAASMEPYDRRERDRFNDAMHELAKFQDRRRSGRFDRGALNKAIDRMSDLARAGRIHPRTRDLIARDISALRYLRDSGDRYNDPYYDRDRRW